MKWLTSEIATGAYEKVINNTPEMCDLIFDVRDLVDKSGNSLAYIGRKIDDGVEFLRKKKRIVVCCDYGMSRSNSIAVGIMMKFYDIDFSSAVNLLKQTVDEEDVKVEMLNTVYSALFTATNEPKDRKNILMTGGSGFLGREVIKIVEKKQQVFSPGSKEINLLTDVLSLDLQVKKFNIDTIAHLANPKIFTTNKSLGDTLVMLKNILDVCRINNVKLVFLSGWEIYSAYISTGLYADEQLPANAKGTYGETKWLCEELIRQYAVNYDLKYQIIRSGPVYGASGEKPKFIYNFIEKASSDKEIITHRYKNGFPTLDLIYITDFAEIISKCIESDYNGELNIGSGTPLSTNDIAHLIKKKLNSKSVISFAEIDEFAPNIIMNASAIERIFNWRPKVTIETGLEQVINEYKSRLSK
jgi:UDP-glucuronate decarboxylase